MVVSPLTGSRDVTLLSTLPTKQIILDWQTSFHLDITDQFRGYSEIFLYRCNDTGLEFYYPFDIVGSAKLYESLEALDWYYMPRKWEHDVAMTDLRGCHNVLEVGCGRGAFVDRLCNESTMDGLGIELNESAVAYAEERNLPVLHLDVHELAREKLGSFDAVCAFQVLEHVSEPRAFLASMIDLLRPNGLLIVAVPNPDSFIQYSRHKLLNQPPHHMLHWPLHTFRNAITQIFPVKINSIGFEPLAEYHVSWYLSTQIARLSRLGLLTNRAGRISDRMESLLTNYPMIRALIRGHTLYISFEKID